MKQSRTRIIFATMLPVACLYAVAHTEGRAAEYADKPIRVVVGIAPGGGLDTVTRIGADLLSDGLNQTVVVDNRPGGGTVIGMEVAARATPDGYTLLSASKTLMLNGILKRAAYDVRKAFVPIVQLSSQPYMLDVTPSLPIRSVKELIVYAKAHPHKLNYGSQGLGSMGHVGMERLKSMAGIDMVHVPYKGASVALIDVMSGQIQLMFASTVASAAHLKSGKLRVIAITAATRSRFYPDLPTVAESGVPGFDLTNSYNFFAPAGTPPAIVEKINRIVAAGMNTPQTRKLLAADGSEVAPPTSPRQFKQKFDSEYAQFEQVVRAAKIRIK